MKAQHRRVCRPAVLIARLGICFSLSMLAIPALSPAVAGAATWDTRCRQAVSAERHPGVQGWDSLPGSTTYSRRQGRFESSAATFWTRSTTFDTVAVYRGRRMRVCESASSRATKFRALGPEIHLRQGERLQRIAVAYPWIAWATRTTRSGASHVSWRRITARDSTTIRRTLRGTLDALAPTTTGDLVTSTISDGRQRVLLRRKGRSDMQIVPSRAVADMKKPALEVWMWEPETLAIGDTKQPLDTNADPVGHDQPNRIIELPLGRRDRTCGRRAGTTSRLTSGHLQARLTDSSRWTDSDLSSEDAFQHLRICTDTGKPVAALTASRSTYDMGAISDRVNNIAIIGDTVLTFGAYESNDRCEEDLGSCGGTVNRAIPISRSGELLTPVVADSELRGEQVLVATRAAAAWISGRFGGDGPPTLWVTDADGARAVPLPGITAITRITLTDTDTDTDTELTVTGSEGTAPTQRSIPIKPLPAGQVTLADKNITRCSATDNSCEPAPTPAG